MRVEAVAVVIIVVFFLFFTGVSYYSDEIVQLKNDIGNAFCPFEPDTVCANVREHKTWEEHIQTEFEKYVRPGDTVIDAGAYVGIHTLKLAKLVGPSGTVHAFEPDPDSFAVLKRNIETNGIKNVKLHNAGLGDSEGNIKISMAIDENRGATQWVYAQDGIKITTIDSLGLEKLDFMKIDVEGMEQKVFMGMRETIKKFRPKILFESFPGNKAANYEILIGEHKYKINNISNDDYIAF